MTGRAVLTRTVPSTLDGLDGTGVLTRLVALSARVRLLLMTTLPPRLLSETRLAALLDFAILDTPAEVGFDDIVQLAALTCAVPVALVSLVDRDRQWFKARVGFPACETDLNSSVCKLVLDEPDILQIEDLANDPRTSANPLVTGEPFIRFYAGAPLTTPDGEVLGSLCVIDKQPRPGGLIPPQLDGLRRLARQVMSQLELRRAIATRDEAHGEEQQAFRTRDALNETQRAIASNSGDLDAVLKAVVAGAMKAVPAADGGVVELMKGGMLEYSACAGTLAAHQGLRLGLGETFAGRAASTGAPVRTGDAPHDPYVRQDLIEKLGLRSAIATPLLRGSTPIGVLKLQSAQSDAFTKRDIDALGLFAGAATVGFAEAVAQVEMHAKDTYWRSLFDRLSEGFTVGEAVRDTTGRIGDWRYIEVNPAWGWLLGVPPDSVIGRTVREVFPGVEEEWVTDFARVVETGETTTFTRQVGILQRWYEGRAFPLEGDRFGVIFLEVTSRIQADTRRAALLSLGDRLRDLTTIGEMTAAASEIVGRTLGASRAGFGRIFGDVEFLKVEPDWNAPGSASIAGRHRFDDYGHIREHLRQGEPLVIDDVTTDPRTRDNPGSMLSLGIGSLANMPVRERGKTVAVFIVHDTKPRHWTPEELAFLRNVADRVEVGVARVRAEETQTVLNHELAHRLKNTLSVVQSIANQTLRTVADREAVTAFEQRILAMSRAHDVLLQRSWTAARLRAVMESVLSMQVDLDRFAFDGPDLDITPEAAMSLSLLLHELATNALKYGSLSAQNGRVRIAWWTEAVGAPNLVLDWSEMGGPPAIAPSNKIGFGTKLLRMGLLGSKGADLHYETTGLRAEFRAPLAHIQVQVH